MERVYGKVPEGIRVFVATYRCGFQVSGVGYHRHEFTVPWIPDEGESERDIPRVIPCTTHPNHTADLVRSNSLDQK